MHNSETPCVYTQDIERLIPMGWETYQNILRGWSVCQEKLWRRQWCRTRGRYRLDHNLKLTYISLQKGDITDPRQANTRHNKS